MSRAMHVFVVFSASIASVLPCLGGCDKLSSNQTSQHQDDAHTLPAPVTPANSSVESEKRARVSPGTPLIEADFVQTLRETGGEYVVVQVYMEACGPCMTEALQLTKIEEQWHQDGVAILGMGMDETPAGAEAFFESTGERIRYPLYFAPWFAKQQQVTATPTLFIYSESGKQLFRIDPLTAETSIMTAIGEKIAGLLAGK